MHQGRYALPHRPTVTKRHVKLEGALAWRYQRERAVNAVAKLLCSRFSPGLNNRSARVDIRIDTHCTPGRVVTQ
jgi:hypothetical protein